MTKKQSNIAFELKERAKELSCLYEVQELLNNKELSIDEIFKEVIKILPQGWQYPDICRVQIVFGDSVYESEDLKKTKWWLKSDIVVQEELLGSINVYYKEKRPNELIGPFLKEEQKLINTIAMQISSFILHKRLKAVFEEGGTVLKDQKPEWYTIFKMLKGTNPKLLVRISRKMINFMCWNGIKEAENLFEFFSPEYKDKIELLKEGNNRPYHETATSDLITTSYRIFELAGEHLDENELVDNIHRWIKEDRSGFLVNVLENNGSSRPKLAAY